MLAYAFHWPPSELWELEPREVVAWVRQVERVHGMIAEAKRRQAKG